MGPAVQRVVGAVATVAVSAAVNLATGLLTGQHAAKWVATAVTLLVVGVAVQWWLPITAPTGRPRRQTAVGNVVGGSFTQKMHGPGEQTAERNKITGGFSQTQDK